MDRSRRVDIHRKRLQDDTDGILLLKIVSGQRTVPGAVVASSFRTILYIRWMGIKSRRKKKQKSKFHISRSIVLRSEIVFAPVFEKALHCWISSLLGSGLKL